MTLSETVRSSIISEARTWLEIQYSGKSKKERQQFGQFFTPAELVIKMIEKYDDLDGIILDPSVGCGGLLAGCIIAGADPKKCYGIEIDPDIHKLCQNRLAKFGVPEENIKLGDALDQDLYGNPDKIIMNPPFKLGNEIWNLARKKSDKVVCLMPISRYKKGKSYLYIKDWEFVDESAFTDAVLPPNLMITTAGPFNMTTWDTWNERSWNPKFKPFYKWNLRHFRNIVPINIADRPYTDFDIDLDFIENIRAIARVRGGFGKNGWGYKWNVLKSDYDYRLQSSWVFAIRFNSVKAKDNFSRYWYWNKKGEALASMALTGLNLDACRKTAGPGLPQIDWEKISDHPLWDKDPDSAVLDTMGLKWNENKDGVIEK